MTTSTTHSSYRIMTRRDLISLAITLGFVAAIPLFVYTIVDTGENGRDGQKVELMANGQLIQLVQDQPVQIASALTGRW